MRTLCSSTLVGEAMVICFASLVAMRLTDLSATTVWAVGGTAAVLCMLLCGMLRFRWAIALGWVLQLGLIASGVVVSMMYLLGIAFSLLWWAAVVVGGKVDAAKAARAAAP